MTQASFGNFMLSGALTTSYEQPQDKAALDAGTRAYADAEEPRRRAESSRANAISITSRPIGSRRAGSDQGQSAARDKRPTAAEPGRKKTNQEQVAVRQRPKERVARNQYGVPGNKSL